MSLLEELKTKRQDAVEMVAGVDLDIEATNATLAEEQRVRAHWVQKIHDIDRAISALTPIEPAAEAKGEDAEPCPVTFDADTPEDERKAIAEGWNAAKRGVARDVSHMREDLKRAWLFGYDAADDPTGIRAEWDVPDTITIASSSQHAEESARAQDLPPLFPAEPPQAATPEELMESGAINGEAYGLWRKLTKAEA